MCREIPTLGTVKTYINIIMSAICGFAIIKQIFNLVLGALGIDDPNLYEETREEALQAQAKTMQTIRTKNKIREYRKERRRRDDS